MKAIRALCFLVLSALALHANAQRVQVPLMNWENIPVSASTSATVSAEQVKKAFVRAALATHWAVTPVADGELEAVFNKQNKHVAVITIRYDAQKYSVSYKRSEGMGYLTELPMNYTMNSHRNGVSQAEQALVHQQALLAHRPDLPFAKLQAKAFIHPFYEDWVYDLLDSVRLNLKRSS
jgi:hypothetical protein